MKNKLHFFFIGGSDCGVKGYSNEIINKTVYPFNNKFVNIHQTDIINNSTPETIFNKCLELGHLRSTNPRRLLFDALI